MECPSVGYKYKDQWGEVECVGVIRDFVVAQREGYEPFVMSMRDWTKCRDNSPLSEMTAEFLQWDFQDVTTIPGGDDSVS